MTVRKKVLVSGRVQGVFFRDSTRREAERRGVAGSARNLPDGRVEVVLEGDSEQVDAVVGFCKEGPPWAEVVDLEIHEEEPVGLSGFSTR